MAFSKRCVLVGLGGGTIDGDFENEISVHCDRGSTGVEMMRCLKKRGEMGYLGFFSRGDVLAQEGLRWNRVARDAS